MANIKDLQQIKIGDATLELMHASALSKGYGHMEITVQLCYGDATAYFKGVTNCMPDFEEANAIEDYDAKIRALYDLIGSGFENQIIEWMYGIDNSND